MPKFMKLLNNISRSQMAFRRGKLEADFASGYHTYILAICKRPGVTQDALAKDICVNKSTVARRLDSLEEEGYVYRKPDSTDKRCLLVYPTEKMLLLLPQVKAVAKEWMDILTRGVSEEEMALFESVLVRMEESARRAAFEMGGEAD